MRLLLDANLSPRIAESLRAAGFEAVHVADLDLVAATDDEIFDPLGATDLWAPVLRGIAFAGPAL
jgi:predicted nuclease of predicted toxin-antitoxin system